MAANCTDNKLLNRSGSSQQQRILSALLPKNARVDERDYADLILFAKKYGTYLNYYNQLHTIDGDWQAFMMMDVSVTLAGLAKTDVKAYTEHLKLIYNNIRNAADEAERKKYFKAIFDFIFSVAIELDAYYARVPDDFEFREYFYSTIQAKLQDPLQRILSYYNDFVTAGYIDNTSDFIPPDTPVEITLGQNFSISQLSAIWQSATPVTAIALSIPNPADVSNSIYHIITHNLFNAQPDIFFKTLSNLVEQSAVFLEQTLTDFPSHTPHYALYLTFLHLFKKAQDQLNLFAGPAPRSLL